MLPALSFQTGTMPRKRKKKTAPVIYLSEGPLPQRMAGVFGASRLVFTDASQHHQGGLAAVLFDAWESSPRIACRSVPLNGSNQLELLAGIFGLEQASQHYPAQSFALFSDNHDAVVRLNRAKIEGLQTDPELACLLLAANCSEDTLAHASIHWIPGHRTSRGNALADRHARAAANQLSSPSLPITASA